MKPLSQPFKLRKLYITLDVKTQGEIIRLITHESIIEELKKEDNITETTMISEAAWIRKVKSISLKITQETFEKYLETGKLEGKETTFMPLNTMKWITNHIFRSISKRKEIVTAHPEMFI